MLACLSVENPDNALEILFAAALSIVAFVVHCDNLKTLHGARLRVNVGVL
jgi:hypothetical protein